MSGQTEAQGIEPVHTIRRPPRGKILPLLKISLFSGLFRRDSGSFDVNKDFVSIVDSPDANVIALASRKNRINVGKVISSPYSCRLEYSWRFEGTNVNGATTISASQREQDIEISTPPSEGNYTLKLEFESKDEVRHIELRNASNEVIRKDSRSISISLTAYVTYGIPISSCLEYAALGVNVFWLDSSLNNLSGTKNERENQSFGKLNSSIYNDAKNGEYGYGSFSGISQKGRIQNHITHGNGKIGFMGNCGDAALLLNILGQLLGTRADTGVDVSISTSDPELNNCDIFMMKPDRKSFGGDINGTKIDPYQWNLGTEAKGGWMFRKGVNHILCCKNGVYYDPTLGLKGDNKYTHVYAKLRREHSLCLPASCRPFETGGFPISFGMLSIYKLSVRGGDEKYIALWDSDPLKKSEGGYAPGMYPKIFYFYVPEDKLTKRELSQSRPATAPTHRSSPAKVSVFPE